MPGMPNQPVWPAPPRPPKLDRVYLYTLISPAFLNRLAQCTTESPIFYNGRPCAENFTFSWGIRTPCNLCFFGVIRTHNVNGISIGSVVFPHTTVERPYTLQWHAHSPPQNLPLPMGDLNPHLIRGPLGPPKSSTQTAYRSVQPFCRGH